MVDSGQLECKKCPLSGVDITNVKSFDTNKVYLIDVTFENAPPLEYLSETMQHIQKCFTDRNISVILTCSQFGLKLNSIVEKDREISWE